MTAAERERQRLVGLDCINQNLIDSTTSISIGIITMTHSVRMQLKLKQINQTEHTHTIDAGCRLQSMPMDSFFFRFFRFY